MAYALELHDPILIAWRFHNPHLHWRKPAELDVVKDGEWYVVDHDELGMYGYGRTLSEAILDFMRDLGEFYVELKADQDKLGPYLQKCWQACQDYIEERA